MDTHVQDLKGLEINGEKLCTLLNSGGYSQQGNSVLVHQSINYYGQDLEQKEQIALGSRDERNCASASRVPLLS